MTYQREQANGFEADKEPDRVNDVGLSLGVLAAADRLMTAVSPSGFWWDYCWGERERRKLRSLVATILEENDKQPIRRRIL